MKVSELEETPYKGNIGFTELMMFYKSASDEQKQQLETLIEQGKNKEAWQLIQAVTGVKLQGPEFGNLDEIIRKVKGGYRLYSKKGKNLGTYPSKSGAEKRERQVQYFKHMGEAGIPRDQMPQISVKDIEGKYNYKKGTISLDKMKPVQTERLEAEYREAVEKIEAGKANPIMLDRKGRIVNGHHRYDAYKNLGYERVPAVLVDATLEELMKEYAHTVEEDNKLLDKPTPTVKELADKFGIDAKEIMRELVLGIKTELEHTSDPKIAREIALDHMREDPKYYSAMHHKQMQPDEPGYKHTQLSAPQNTLVIDKSDDFDFYKLGQHYPNISKLDPHEIGVGGTDIVMTFASKEEMENMIRALDKMGVAYRDISGSHEHPEVHTKENFADGKKPGRKGLAKRMGVDCSKSETELRKIAKNSSGEKQRMAHWCANMKGGKK